MYMKKKPNYENKCDRHAYNKENKNVQSGGRGRHPRPWWCSTSSRKAP